MGIKKFFGGGSGQPSEGEYTIEDLIVLGRFEDAVGRLQAKVKKSPRDLYSHLKLAEVFEQQKKWLKSVDEYVFVADCYAEDGFYDKGIALLTKAARLAPLDESLGKRITRLQAFKQLEHSRSFFLEAVDHIGDQESPLDRLSPVEVQLMWKRLGPTPFVLALPGEQLKRLISEMKISQFEAGRTLAVRGGTDRVLYLLVSGAVEAILEGPQETVTSVRSFTSGSLLGDWPLFEQKPWPATLVVREPLLALVLTREGLERALQGNADPRCLLEALRSQRNDQELAYAIHKLQATP